MAKISNSVNEQIFYALKVSEVSNVPVLIISNPGVGKSTTVELFSKIRGYHCLVLKGNSSNNDEICGYDTVPEGITSVDGDVHPAAIGLRPAWFQEILDKEEQGQKTLLFIDEITTANEFVQAALLHVIFERSCKGEKLPKDTLIVAAGNYAANLSASMNLISPLMNRFAIFNIIPTSKDVTMYLNKFAGSIASQSHIPGDSMKELTQLLVSMDKQQLELPVEKYNQIGEYFETALTMATKMLIEKDKQLSWEVTDLSAVYSGDGCGDGKLYGFVTLRTLCYLRDWAIATYLCFGDRGIKSANFANAINGLCGIGLSYDGSRKNSEPKINKVGDTYRQCIESCLQDILKLDNSTCEEYSNFFIDLSEKVGKVTNKTTGAVKAKNPLAYELIPSLVSKLSSLAVDPKMQGIQTPVDEGILCCLSNSLSNSTDELTKKLKSKKNDGGFSITPEQLNGAIQEWNTILSAFTEITRLVNDSNRKYSMEIKGSVTRESENSACSIVELLSKMRRYVINTAKEKGDAVVINEIAINQ